ncbi:MAG: hypothetical protein A3B37_02465 [Candidatus Sungbacteria bacterium RIFCSPLOWO2_01_FULL_59_16]|uniref:Uncharacterized protein n=1 Tax=Candidatus Sungbacteria bacterium RIFCSPLOWO2_01_FULL_59_16 TaxID=1802280 RepID=A0A1G2LCP0_9BACT|nr:MAG: hypothetical protein A3B37_02465 [Candidatus Sungbacteria bacterium RIFCSPLOWO2_01_FULL_59_16]
MALHKQLSHESREIRREVRERTLGYILTALGLVAGLAWNEAITAFIAEVFPLSKNGLAAKIIYAVVITIVVVVVNLSVVRFAERRAGDQER